MLYGASPPRNQHFCVPHLCYICGWLAGWLAGLPTWLHCPLCSFLCLAAISSGTQWWSKQLHRYYPEPYKAAARAMLLANRATAEPLPVEILCQILAHTSLRDWMPQELQHLPLPA